VSAAYHIRNALSPDLQYYRLSITPSLLDKVHSNVKAGYDNFALYELGTAHNKQQPANTDAVLAESKGLALVISKKAVGNATAPYYLAQHWANYLLTSLGLQCSFVAVKTNNHTMAPYDVQRSAAIVTADGTILGVVGEYNTNTVANFKLPAYSAGFEVDCDQLLRCLGAQQSTPLYTSLTKYPAVYQDMTFEVPLKTTHAILKQHVVTCLSDLAKEHNYGYRVNNGSVYTKSTDATKRITFSIKLWHANKTLTSTEATQLTDSLATIMQSNHNAKRM
jgi:phenylalanyl-tRNA synthetase beta chain